MATAKAKYYIGLMSGTSADGIDLALVDFNDTAPTLIASSYSPYTSLQREKIVSLYNPDANEIDRLGVLDKELAHAFAQAVNSLLTEQNLGPQDIIAIGNHGQTIRHRPQLSTSKLPAFTLQIGCSQTLACLTDIDVIGQFRQKDIALGGQGAPLVPAFHQALFTSTQESNDSDDHFIVNIGGIANITYLPANKQNNILGFDTGPGNCLMDDWYQQHHSNGYYDQDGDWAASGLENIELLNELLSENYFALPAPKSTGREIFNKDWLNIRLSNEKLTGDNLSPQDIQATLVSLTARTIAEQIMLLCRRGKIVLCGGGKNNNTLKNNLKNLLSSFEFIDIESLGFDGDALEAMAFAWLAHAYKNNFNSNIPAVTGAHKSTTLGVLFTP